VSTTFLEIEIMSHVERALSAPWQYYHDRAREAHFGPADFFGFGREEQLWETLAVIEAGAPFNDACQQRLDRIPQNRAKKYRRLMRYLKGAAVVFHRSGEQAVDVADEAAAAQSYLTPTEREVEIRLATGDNFGDIAPDVMLSTAALKMRASRWRQRVREARRRASKLLAQLNGSGAALARERSA
jgi:hypothetical protein